MSKKKKTKRSTKIPSKKARKAYKQVEPVMRPLLELFAVVDDVMDEHGAFEPDRIHKSLGRVYRAWLDTRDQLDSDFNRDKYRHEMKSKPKKTPLGREQLASTSQKSSTDQKSTSEKKRKKSKKHGKPMQSKSAKAVRSDDHASGGQSQKQKNGECGEASPTEKGKGSRSGSKDRVTPKSRKKKS